jgi:hypothetical protein
MKGGKSALNGWVLPAQLDACVTAVVARGVSGPSTSGARVNI